MSKKGVFICLEGLDGCGKTTQTRILAKKLRKEGYDTVATAEPSRGRIGQFIRECCLDGDTRLSPVVEALLFAADRFEHVNNEVIPALSEGKIVISDRYVYSSLAYQGAAGLDLKWIAMINEHAIRPDLAVFIDVDPETVIGRLKPKKSVMENLQTQQDVKKVYMKFVDKGDLTRIDGNKSENEVADLILRVVTEFLEKAS